MSCTTAVFTLMSVATALGCAALYFYYTQIVNNLKAKINTFNMALTNLQEERHILKTKNETLYLETATQTVDIEKLNEEVTFLRTSLERLENDNRLLMREYSAVFNGQRTISNGQWTMNNAQ